MDFFTKLMNGLLDKGGLIVIGGACVFFFKRGKLPHFMGPVAYGITTVGALGVIRYIVMDLEKDKCDELILDLEEVNAALDNKICETQKVKDFTEFIAEKRDLLQGWRQDSARLDYKVKAVENKSSLHRKTSNIFKTECNVEQADDSRNVREASSTNETEDGDLTKESNEKRDLAEDRQDLDDLMSGKLENENKEENKANLARSDVSTGSHDSLESKELANELETILAELEKIPKSIVKPRGGNVGWFYEEFSTKFSSERLEGLNVENLKQAQGEAKNMHGKMMTKSLEILNKDEEKKHPRWEASAETGAIKKPEKRHERHENKRHIRKEKVREHKDSHGKGTLKESFEKSHQQESQSKGNWRENLEKVKQLHKTLRDIPDIKIHLEESTHEESVTYDEKMKSHLEDSSKVEEKLQDIEENRSKLTEVTEDDKEEKENYEKRNELFEGKKNITDDAVENIQLERTSIESENKTEEILHVETEEVKDEHNLNDIEEEKEKSLRAEQEEKQQTESQGIESSECPQEEENEEKEEKHEDSSEVDLLATPTAETVG